MEKVFIYIYIYTHTHTHIYTYVCHYGVFSENFAPKEDIERTTILFITLVNGKLDAQLFYFIMRLLQSSTCFEQRRARHQEVRLY